MIASIRVLISKMIENQEKKLKTFTLHVHVYTIHVNRYIRKCSTLLKNGAVMTNRAYKIIYLKRRDNGLLRLFNLSRANYISTIMSLATP